MKNKSTFNDLKTKLTGDDIMQLEKLIGHGCRQKTKDRLVSILKYGPSSIPHCGILERLTLEEGHWRYCAGQSYPDEIKTIRELILKGE